MVRAADVIITMGCGDACPVFPGKRYEEWELADPAGLAVSDVRPIRDDIERRVLALIDQLRGSGLSVLDAHRQVSPVSDTPSVRFVCVHNAGRSRIAAG